MTFFLLLRNLINKWKQAVIKSNLFSESHHPFFLSLRIRFNFQIKKLKRWRKRSTDRRFCFIISTRHHLPTPSNHPLSLLVCFTPFFCLHFLTTNMAFSSLPFSFNLLMLVWLLEKLSLLLALPKSASLIGYQLKIFVYSFHKLFCVYVDYPFVTSVTICSLL